MKYLITCGCCFFDREDRIDMIHSFSHDQFICYICIQHLKHLCSIRIYDLVCTNKDSYIFDPFQIPIDRADLPVMNVQISCPTLTSRNQ